MRERDDRLARCQTWQRAPEGFVDSTDRPTQPVDNIGITDLVEEPPIASISSVDRSRWAGARKVARRTRPVGPPRSRIADRIAWLVSWTP